MVLLVLLNAHTHTRPFVSDKIDSLEVFTICGSILYALAGMLFYPSITEEAQGELCVGDVEGHACDSEIDLKMIIGVRPLSSSPLNGILLQSTARLSAQQSVLQRAVRTFAEASVGWPGHLAVLVRIHAAAGVCGGGDEHP